MAWLHTHGRTLGSVREATAADYAAVLALNNSATPHVNNLSAEQFSWLAAHAAYFRLCPDERGVAGFAIALQPGLAYWSDNYKWFSMQGEPFLYLDRVVVAESARRQGVGRSLYDDIAVFAHGRWPRITLEVNLRPANQGSLAFHVSMGYRRMGEREFDAGEKAVVLLERVLPAP